MAKIEQTGRGKSVESKLDAQPERSHFATFRGLVRYRLQKLMRAPVRWVKKPHLGKARFLAAANWTFDKSCMSAKCQTEKNSVRAYVFRFAFQTRTSLDEMPACQRRPINSRVRSCLNPVASPIRCKTGRQTRRGGPPALSARQRGILGEGTSTLL
jgi:hypothetical protein